MKFRRRKDTSASGEGPDAEPSAADEGAGAPDPAGGSGASGPAGEEPAGPTGQQGVTEEGDAAGRGGGTPWPRDAEEVDLTGGAVDRVDLGSLLLEEAPGKEIRLQVSEETQDVQSVLIAGEDGALELKPFAAPRGEDFWEEVRPQIAADVAQHGGTASEQQGAFGPELECELPVQTSDGQRALQTSRIIGINGPRWLLRATLLGTPASDRTGSQEWEALLTRVVVRRGSEAMAAGAPLPIVMPEQARSQED